MFTSKLVRDFVAAHLVEHFQISLGDYLILLYLHSGELISPLQEEISLSETLINDVLGFRTSFIIDKPFLVYRLIHFPLNTLQFAQVTREEYSSYTCMWLCGHHERELSICITRTYTREYNWQSGLCAQYLHWRVSQSVSALFPASDSKTVRLCHISG